MTRNQRRAASARAAKWQHEKGELIVAWSLATGRPSDEWWNAATAAGLRPGQGTEHNRKVRAWFRDAIAEAEGSK